MKWPWRKKVVEEPAPELPNHRFLFSGAEADGTLVFICTSCPEDLRIHRESLRRVLVERHPFLTSLSRRPCSGEFPNGMTRILPERAAHTHPHPHDPHYHE